MNNRLQLRHCNTLFETRQEAIEYIQTQIRFATEGLALKDKSQGFSLYGEPTVLKYKNEDDATNPHIIIAVGAVTNEGTQYNDNRFCIIDADKTASDIESLEGALADAVKALTVITKDTNSLKLYTEKGEDGTVISGDVVVADSQVYTTKYGKSVRPNIIKSTDDGLFTYVHMDYVPSEDKIVFSVNGKDSVFKINNNYLVEGYYTKKDETLHLIEKDGTDISISLEDLIAEWDVEGEASNTPIVLTKEEIGYGDDPQHYHVEPWQDILKADVRIADKEARPYNILSKTSDGRYLYVDGLASNVSFYKNGEVTNVQSALEAITNDASNDSTNIIYKKADGYYASAKLSYDGAKNALTFTTSAVGGGVKEETFTLNAVKFFEKAYYDAHTEILYISYTDGNGLIQTIEIPISDMVSDWEVQNMGHNVKINKSRSVSGPDTVSADVNIHKDDDNILVEKSHELFVKGTADNIRYGKKSNVEAALDGLTSDLKNVTMKANENSDRIDMVKADLNLEEARAKGEEAKLNEKITAEVARSTEKDNAHEASIKTVQDEVNDFIKEYKNTIDSIRYDANTEAIVFTYMSEGKKLTKSISLANLIEEWTVSEATDGAIRLTKLRGEGNGKDILSANVVISELPNNMLVNKDGALYVSNEQMLENSVKIAELVDKSAEIEDGLKTVKESLKDETNRAVAKENAIVADLNNEAKERGNADNALDKKIDGVKGDISLIDNEVKTETSKREAADAALKADIDSERNRAIAAEKAVKSSVEAETTRAISAENLNSEAIYAEKNRAIGIENGLATDITKISGNVATLTSDLAKEANDRAAAITDAIDDLYTHVRPIEFNGSTSVKVSRVSSTGKSEDEVTYSVIVSNSDKNIITSSDIKGGLYASVNLQYNSSANTLKLVGTDGIALSDTIQLSIGSLIQGIDYDKNTQEIVIRYTKSGETQESEVRVSVSDLFNQWEINEGNCNGIMLHKNTVPKDGSNVDELWGEAVLSNSPNNILSIVDKGLYVGGQDIEDLKGKAICATKQITDISHAVFGESHLVPNCKDTFTYEPDNRCHYISGATDMRNADYVLDYEINEANKTITDLRDKLALAKQELRIAEKNVFGEELPEGGKYADGSAYVFKPIMGSEYIKDAATLSDALGKLDKKLVETNEQLGTSNDKTNNIESVLGTSIDGNGNLIYPTTTDECLLKDAKTYAAADKILENAVCSMEGMLTDTSTATNTLTVVTEGGQKKIKIATKLSHGNNTSAWQTDEELVISGYTASDFTDTNVLRIVDIKNGEDANSNFNGLYLSNVWDCGEYADGEVQSNYNSRYKNSSRK